MTRTKRKPSKAKNRPEVLADKPTAEQLEKSEFRRVGMAYKRVAVIDLMFADHKLTQRQYDGLARYRDVAIADERSPVRDSLDPTPRGGGSGAPPSALRVAIELGRLERALGSLRAVARAIAVDDMTLAQWAVHQHGSHPVDRKGVIRFEPAKRAVDFAWMDIRMAGLRLASEIGA
jgi:hypothetical protein